ncbi:TSC22 domain family protein 1-like isoform X3 [Trichomycterus rosablanca]|uniref:TSC22 domain family protein 1-like isoform X3 n=1 Tax=Trichomycterus rosablanca TaxID=2290929 RepID=UPI002F361179
MHHSESTGDSPGIKKMAHASVFTSRRGSNTGSSGMSSSSNSASMNCNSITTDDHQSLLLMQHTSSTGSFPGLHHPPNSLNVHTQSQSLQGSGTQIKKKSGFQITSVLPAHVSASTNNSIADDTESYDEMDESHTEDLSSSDILDVSVSRATDTGIPERSSSEETLNSLHGGKTPGVVSPNEPVKHHVQTIQQEYMVNGTVHLSHQLHGLHKDQGMHSLSASQPAQGVLVCSQSVGNVVTAAGSPVKCGSAVQGRTQRAPSVQGEIGATGLLNQLLSSVSSSTSGAGNPECVVVTSANGGNLVETGNMIEVTATSAQPPPTTNSTHSQVSTVSRFRVVKLDSSTEPFKKGRWLCTEYYEKEGSFTAPFTDSAAPNQAVETIIQSDSETTSGSSSSSTINGGGDQGAQPVQQTYSQPAVPTYSSLFQTTPQIHINSQDPVICTVVPATVVPPNNPQFVSVPGLLGTEGQSHPTRPQQQISSTVEGQAGQKNDCSINQQLSGNQSLQPVDYAHISQGIQITVQSHQMPPVQDSVTSGATSVAGLPLGTPAVAAPQVISPRPQVPAPQMMLTQVSTVGQAQQNQPHLPPEQQQAIVSQPSQQSSITTVYTVPSIPSSLQSNFQPVTSQTVQLGGPVAGHSGGVGLTLHQQVGQSSQLPPARGLYAGVASLTASQLEDAGRLLFQHQSLLSLPRLTTGGVSGLIGSVAGANLGQEGSASVDASAFAGTDEESSLGSSVVAIDNKIEQAMYPPGHPRRMGPAESGSSQGFFL